MMNMYALLTVSLLFAASCAPLQNSTKVHEMGNGLYHFDYSADRRGAVLYMGPIPADFHYCAEPSPDIALQAFGRLEAQLANAPISPELSIELHSSVVELAGRTQTIMLLRESLYRLCELSITYPHKDADRIYSLYEKVVNAAIELSKTPSSPKKH